MAGFAFFLVKGLAWLASAGRERNPEGAAD